MSVTLGLFLNADEFISSANSSPTSITLAFYFSLSIFVSSFGASNTLFYLAADFLAEGLSPDLLRLIEVDADDFLAALTLLAFLLAPSFTGLDF